MIDIYRTDVGTPISWRGQRGKVIATLAPGAGGRNMYGPPSLLARFDNGQVKTIGTHIGMLSPDIVEIEDN